MPQQLALFPGLKTERGYSAVVLDRYQARPALCRSVFCTGMVGGSWEPEATLVSLGYLSSCSSSTPCFLLCPGRTQPNAVFGDGAVSTGQSAVTFVSTFLFEAPPLFAWVTSRTRLCHIDDPRSFTLRTSTSTTP